MYGRSAEEQKRIEHLMAILPMQAREQFTAHLERREQDSGSLALKARALELEMGLE